VHAYDQHFLVVGTIEYSDLPAFGQPARGAPEEIMLQFVGARLFETGNLAALRIDPGHDVPDDAVLTSRVHPLKYQQQRIAVGRVVKVLQRAQLLNVLFRSVRYSFFDLQQGFTTVGHSPSWTF